MPECAGAAIGQVLGTYRILVLHRQAAVISPIEGGIQRRIPSQNH